MNKSEEFSQWFGSYRARVTRDSFKCLEADLALLIRENRGIYDTMNTRIADMQNNKADDGYGPRRLRLKGSDRAEHSNAKRARAAAHQRLRVLVPLLRFTKIALNQWTTEALAPAATLSAALWPLRLTLAPFEGNGLLCYIKAPYECAQFGHEGKVEREVAAQLVRDHPSVFFRPTVVALEEKTTVAVTPKDTQATQKSALYAKIVKEMALSEAERTLLRAALA